MIRGGEKLGRRSLRGLGAVAFAFAAAPAHAQSGEVVIHVVYHNYYERVRPSQWAGGSDQEMTLILSGKNSVREVFSASYGRFSDSWSSSGTLGEARWRVVGPNLLQRTKDLPQCTRIDTIDIQGDGCQARWEYRLKPGFTEYEIKSVVSKQWAFYSEARMVSSTCDISAR